VTSRPATAPAPHAAAAPTAEEDSTKPPTITTSQTASLSRASSGRCTAKACMRTASCSSRGSRRRATGTHAPSRRANVSTRAALATTPMAIGGRKK
jgi:hypothetical protein